MIRGKVLTILAALLGVTAACSLGVAAYIIIQPGASPESGVAETEVMEASETDVEPTEKDSTISVEAELAPNVVNDNDSGYDMNDNDASASSIMDATNNPGGIVQTDDDTYADDAAKDRENEGSNDGTNNDANRNTDGTYSWQVNGVTITTRINVMDYVDGNVWNANEMAAALGWDPIAMKIDGSYNVSMKSKKPACYKSNGLLIYYSNAGSRCNGISGHIEGGDMTFDIAVGGNGGYSYRMNDADFYWTMEEIVCFAYAMENMPNNNDPFANVLNGSRSSYVIE